MPSRLSRLSLQLGATDIADRPLFRNYPVHVSRISGRGVKADCWANSAFLMLAQVPAPSLQNAGEQVVNVALVSRLKRTTLVLL